MGYDVKEKTIQSLPSWGFSLGRGDKYESNDMQTNVTVHLCLVPREVHRTLTVSAGQT